MTLDPSGGKPPFEVPVEKRRDITSILKVFEEMGWMDGLMAQLDNIDLSKFDGDQLKVLEGGARYFSFQCLLDHTGGSALEEVQLWEIANAVEAYRGGNIEAWKLALDKIREDLQERAGSDIDGNLPGFPSE